MNKQHPFSNPVGQRIAIIGNTGSGKTTLAARLAGLMGAPHIELDALYWGPNWTGTPPDVFRARVIQVINSEAWVADGNYRELRDIIWGRADTLVWLDYSLPVILGRLFKRTLHRVVTHEELWTGNRESFRGAFFSRNSLFIWALSTHKRRRREYPAYLTQPAYQHLAVIHLTSPCQTKHWLRELGVSASAPTNTSPR